MGAMTIPCHFECDGNLEAAGSFFSPGGPETR